MSKDKKKKKKKSASGISASAGLRALTRNPLVADIVATTLVATAAALKDSKKARRLAAEAGDELETLAKEGAERGNAMWQLALDVGRRALDTYVGDSKAAPASSRTPKAGKAAKSPKKTKRNKGPTRAG